MKVLGRALVMAGGFLLAFASSAPAIAGAVDSVSAKEFSIYKDWIDGREDPRLAEASEALKKKKIAKSLGVSVAQLDEAIAKVGPVYDSLASEAKSSVKAQLAGTPLKGRILDIIIDTNNSHAVAGVQWKCGDIRDVEKEAAYAGWAAQKAAPMVKTVGVWCVDGAKKKQFSAKASATSLATIDPARVERFAKARYIRLFREVKIGPHS